MRTVTPAQFAEALGINPRTAVIWARAGKIRAAKDDRGRWRIDAREMDPERRQRIGAREFAQRVGVCYRTVVRWCNAGKLDAVQNVPGGAWMVAAKDVGRVRQDDRREQS